MFIQSQGLPWRPAAIPGVDGKTLSRDETSGAVTQLLRYPPGWRRTEREHWTVDEEFLVLDGYLDVGVRRYGRYGYAYLPAGFLRSYVAAPEGAVVLSLTSAAPRAEKGEAPPGRYDQSLLVAQVVTAEHGLEGWVKNPFTRYLVGTGVQPLRVDPRTGGQSFLYSALPFRYMAKRWTHTTVQEMYVLAGDYAINDVGVMRPGAYAWWRERVVHGPYGSQTGFMMFIRSVGGALENIIENELVPVDYAAPYRPQLPDELRPFAHELPAQRNY
jgi:hypothetical protein